MMVAGNLQNKCCFTLYKLIYSSNKLTGTTIKQKNSVNLSTFKSVTVFLNSFPAEWPALCIILVY